LAVISFKMRSFLEEYVLEHGRMPRGDAADAYHAYAAAKFARMEFDYPPRYKGYGDE